NLVCWLEPEPDHLAARHLTARLEPDEIHAGGKRTAGIIEPLPPQRVIAGGGIAAEQRAAALAGDREDREVHIRGALEPEAEHRRAVAGIGKRWPEPDVVRGRDIASRIHGHQRLVERRR